MAAQEGILYVCMAPKSSLPIERFHDWYMNEHGPMRLRMPQLFRNGFRYRATDLETSGKGQAEWMAVYDVKNTADLVKEPYTSLRSKPIRSDREIETMKEIDVDRKFFDLLREWKSDNWTPVEDVQAEGKSRVLVQVSLTLKPGKSDEEVEKWYAEEHVPLLQKVPGWLRTRRFKLSAVEPRDTMEYMALHEYEPTNGIGGPEFQKATSTAWTKKIYEEYIAERRRREFSLYYTFGQAPRDLTSLSSPNTKPVTSADGKTRTFPVSANVKYPAIESYIVTNDNVELPYRLEGSSDPNAPLIVLDNCILAEYGIWDDFVAQFLAKPGNDKYRILRFNKRGRYSACGDKPINVDVLASDVIALLDAFRVPKAAAFIGVSLGGCTMLNAAISNPDRVEKFVCSDSASAAIAGNDKAWNERTEVAEKQGTKDSKTGEAIIGTDLAELTVRRWFTKNSYEKPETVKEIERVKKMVETNSLEGFKKSVKALFAYDLKDKSENSKVTGMFVVGDSDGVMPKAMEKMAPTHGSKHGSSAKFAVIKGAGHLPMVENPSQFTDEVHEFLIS